MAAFTDFYTATPRFTHTAGLDVMRCLMDRLGNPQDSLRCIHIAGTNGKGSCAAMTASILQAAGYKTALYTSPDLNGLHERLQIDCKPIPEGRFAEITDIVRHACEELPEPSYFEKITAAAFLYFAECSCDYVVLETGLGGRLDATNIIKKPVCSVIMPIGLDHVAQLGSTIAAIAKEKCGIIKPGCPVVSAVQPPEAAAVITETCRSTGSTLITVKPDSITRIAHDITGQTFSYRGSDLFHIRLLGSHQTENACAAIETAQVLGISCETIRQGLAGAQWPGRLEYFPGSPSILLDGAHNAHGAAALSAALNDYFPNKKFTVILAVMADKDWQDIIKYIFPHAAEFLCAAPDNPRALTPQTLAGQIHDVPASSTESLAQALELACSRCRPILACGSLYAIGALRALLTDS